MELAAGQCNQPGCLISNAPAVLTEYLPWPRVQSSKSIAALRKFLADFPSSPHRAEALRLVDVLAEAQDQAERRAALRAADEADWQVARTARSLQATRRYLEKWPHGVGAKEAQAHIASARKWAVLRNVIGAACVLIVAIVALLVLAPQGQVWSRLHDNSTATLQTADRSKTGDVALDASPDGKLVLATFAFTRDKTAMVRRQIWDVEARRIAWQDMQEAANAAFISFADGGRTLHLMDREKVRVVDLASGRELRRIEFALGRRAVYFRPAADRASYLIARCANEPCSRCDFGRIRLATAASFERAGSMDGCSSVSIERISDDLRLALINRPLENYKSSITIREIDTGKSLESFEAHRAQFRPTGGSSWLQPGTPISWGSSPFGTSTNGRQGFQPCQSTIQCSVRDPRRPIASSSYGRRKRLLVFRH